MLVLIGGLLVVSFLYFVSVMKKDDQTDITSSSSPHVKLEDRKYEQQTSSTDEGSNMECSQSTSEYVCSRCGSSPTTAIKIEERVIESTCEIIEETTYESCLRYYKDDDFRRVPFPEAGVDIVDRKLKNTQESLDREINEDHEDDVLTYTESWTENWLFRKKNDDKTKPHNEDAAMKPVAMFVPNTTAKYRAMIGDRDVDEMSDLSDCANNEEDDDELDSGKDAENRVAKYIYDRRARLLLDGKSKHHRETCDGHCHESTDGIDGTNDAESNRSCRSELFIESYCNDVNHQNTRELSMSDNDKLSDIDFNLFSPPRPGTIADREHRKWLTAAPMENNPYSEENLQKRLLERKYTPKYSSASSLLGHARINGYDDETVVENIDFESIDLPEKSSTPIVVRVVEEEEDKSAEKLNDDDDDEDTKNTSTTIVVTKNNARINDDCRSEEKICLPSVRKLVEVFSEYQRKRGIYVKPTKDKNINEPEEIKFERSQPRPLHLHSLTARSLSKEFREGLR